MKANYEKPVVMKNTTNNFESVYACNNNGYGSGALDSSSVPASPLYPAGNTIIDWFLSLFGGSGGNHRHH